MSKRPKQPAADEPQNDGDLDDKARGQWCRLCGAPTKIIRTEYADEARTIVARRRRCTGCGRRFNTTEVERGCRADDTFSGFMDSARRHLVALTAILDACCGLDENGGDNQRS